MTREEILADMRKMANVLRSVQGKPDANVNVAIPFSVAIEAGLCTPQEAAWMERDGKYYFVYTDTGDFNAA